jgi:hypothetical protein
MIDLAKLALDGQSDCSPPARNVVLVAWVDCVRVRWFLTCIGIRAAEKKISALLKNSTIVFVPHYRTSRICRSGTKRYLEMDKEIGATMSVVSSLFPFKNEVLIELGARTRTAGKGHVLDLGFDFELEKNHQRHNLT